MVLNYIKIIFFLFLCLKFSCAQVNIEDVKPIIHVVKTGDQSVKLDWDEINGFPSLVRFVITYTTDHWKTQHEWPAQAIDLNVHSFVFNKTTHPNMRKLECLNECIKMINCIGVISPQSKNYNEPCELHYITDDGVVQDVNCDRTKECSSITTNQNSVTLSNLPYHNTYYFKVKVYDSHSGKWSSESDSSDPIDIKIDFEYDLTSTYKDRFLTLKPKDIEYGKQIARFTIAVTKENTNYLEISEKVLDEARKTATYDADDFAVKDNSLYSIKFSKDFYERISEFFDVDSAIEDMTQETCAEKCQSDLNCKTFAFDTYRTCYLQTAKPLRAIKCYNDTYCGKIKNYFELTLKNLSEATTYSVSLTYESFYGDKSTYTASHKTPATWPTTTTTTTITTTTTTVTSSHTVTNSSTNATETTKPCTTNDKNKHHPLSDLQILFIVFCVLGVVLIAALVSLYLWKKRTPRQDSDTQPIL